MALPGRSSRTVDEFALSSRDVLAAAEECEYRVHVFRLVASKTLLRLTKRKTLSYRRRELSYASYKLRPGRASVAFRADEFVRGHCECADAK